MKLFVDKLRLDNFSHRVKTEFNNCFQRMYITTFFTRIRIVSHSRGMRENCRFPRYNVTRWATISQITASKSEAVNSLNSVRALRFIIRHNMCFGCF